MTGLLCRLPIAALLALSFAISSPAQDLAWPREITRDDGKITVYQPEIDSFENNQLKGRAAVSWIMDGKDPLFGATWFTARVDVDREERLVHIQDVTVDEVRAADETDYTEAFNALVQDQMKNSDLTLSLDHLIASLDATGRAQAQADALAVTPPKVIFEKQPALLMVVDGEPLLRDIEGTRYKAVINTPYPLIQDDANNAYYLNAAKDVWYRATQIEGPWSFDSAPPAEVTALVQMSAEASQELEQVADLESDAGDSESVTASNAPKIIVATEPTELIVADGEPNFAPLVDDLLVMTNTDNHVFMHVSAQQYYVVLSGRWYRSKTMEGPWEYVKSDALPAAFANIPEDTESSDARVYVAGTDEAREAVLDAQIPQTAAVERGPAELNIVYDGAPQFEPIEETEIEYAVNTGDSVILAENRYYCVREGVWYVADSPDGPWMVSDHTPPGIDDIPPSSPVYNVKHVTVYEATPEVVYVGYQPGYLGSYVYGPTVVYGTGYYYRPWITPRYYFPYQRTWGFHVTYNPWTGWGFGMSWHRGPFHFGFHSGGLWHGHYGWWGGGFHRGWYGVGGYRPGFSHHHVRNDINVNINNFNRVVNRNNIYNRNTQIARVRNTRNLTNVDRTRITPPNSNIARNRAGNQNVATNRDTSGNVLRPSQTATRDRTQTANREAANRARTTRAQAPGQSTRQTVGNNVYTDRSGNVHRQTNNGWQTRSNNQWQRQASSPNVSTRNTQLNQQAHARQVGQTRSQQFHQVRSGYSGGRAAGGRRR